MALISKDIPSLFNGVSQQPATLRSYTQCEAMENAYPSLAEGLRKRPPSQHVAKLNALTDEGALIHMIQVGPAERYWVYVQNGDLIVYDKDGVAQTMVYTNGKGYLGTGGAAARDSFALVTLGGTTVVLNKTVTVALDAAVSAGSLAGTKQRFSDLASATGSNAIWEITGDNTNKFDNYYVKDTGTWVEWIKPGIQYALNLDTMPYQLTKTGATTWTLQRIAWNNRTVGDDVSCPAPDFIGKKLNDAFLFRGRLGFLSGTYEVLSRSGEYYNFWAETALAVLDTDPISLEASHTKLSSLNYGVPFNSALMIFSDQTQFQFSAGDLLTPKTARLDPITEFESSTTCRPAGAGQEAFFAVNRGSYTTFRNYYVDSQALSNDAADITAHVPSYIPGGVFHIRSSTSEDVLTALTTQARNKVFVYKYYWTAEEKIQSAWGQWVFSAGDVILGVEFVSNTMYLAVKRSDGTYLEKVEIDLGAVDTGLGYLAHLDRRVSLTGVYDATNNWTTWTLPYTDSAAFDVVLGTSFPSQAGVVLNNPTRPATTTVRVVGKWDAGACLVGRRYTFMYEFSELHMKDANNATVTSGRMMLRQMALTYANTGYFKVDVTPYARSTYTSYFTGKILGDASFVLGTTPIHSGTHRFMLAGNNIGMRIVLSNDSPLPCAFLAASFLAEFVLLGQRS